MFKTAQRQFPSFKYGQALCLSLLLLLLAPLSGFSQGSLPSLDHYPGTPAPTLTPAQDFSPAPAAAPASESNAYHPVSYSSPAMNTSPRAAGKRVTRSLGHLLQGEHDIKPLGYSPLPGIVIFPVIKHGNEKAFGDLPTMFAREYAQRLELKAPETKIYHPVYTVDELRMQGLGHVYDQIMTYYLKAGRPEPMAMDYLLKQLSNNSKPIARVIFVEADLDMTHPEQSTNAGEWLKQIMTDAIPRQMNYFVRSRLQVFDAETPEFQMVWAGSWVRSIKTNRFLNVTPSVFTDSDSQQSFAAVSRQMSREILYTTPKAAYMYPQYDTAVVGQVVPQKRWQKTPHFSESLPQNGALDGENKNAVQRILRRQNPGNP
ncbi:hypothetical protein [Vampirovibrio sp.]|uniref:hypothetical protein n=1 Tax=Vampirovibrio sp. TaxID=2717857 RepID=UPI00359303C7